MLTSTEAYDSYTKYLPKGLIPVSLNKFTTMLTSIDQNHADQLIDAIAQKDALAVHEVLTFDVSEVVKPGEI